MYLQINFQLINKIILKTKLAKSFTLKTQSQFGFPLPNQRRASTMFLYMHLLMGGKFAIANQIGQSDCLLELIIRTPSEFNNRKNLKLSSSALKNAGSCRSVSLLREAEKLQLSSKLSSTTCLISDTKSNFQRSPFAHSRLRKFSSFFEKVYRFLIVL